MIHHNRRLLLQAPVALVILLACGISGLAGDTAGSAPGVSYSNAEWEPSGKMEDGSLVEANGAIQWIINFGP